nr:hypothetical protein [Pseudomonas protegens]
MNSCDDFRFRSHELLVELDAITTKIMMMVALNQVSGPGWNEATEQHRDAFEAWNSFLNSSTPPSDER